MTQTKSRNWLYVMVCVLCGLVLTLTYSLSQPPAENTKFGIIAMKEGTAFRPYIWRRMVPDIVGVLEDRMPQKLKTKLIEADGGTRANSLADHSANDEAVVGVLVDRILGPNPAARPALFLLYGVHFFFWTLGLLLLRSIRPGRSDLLQSLAQAGFVLAATVAMFRGYTQIYDPATFAIGAAVAVLTRRNASLWWAVPFGPMAYWNKESSLLLLLPWVVCAVAEKNWKRDVPPILMTGIALAIVKFVYLKSFTSPYGSDLEFQLFNNFGGYAISKLPLFVWCVAGFIAVWVLCSQALNETNERLAKITKGTLLAFIVFSLVFGNILELRVLIEWIPLASLGFVSYFNEDSNKLEA